MRAVLLAVALALAAAGSARAAQATQQEVEEALTCQCGCGLTVHSCNHLQCGSGEPMKKEIAERLGRGESKEQILDAFRARLGEKVLSSPTMQGFNWLAWVTPFAALLVAGTVLTVAIQRRARAAADVVAPTSDAPHAPPSDAARARLARELDTLDES